tara:strand:- start:16230 stop:16643 length:414 start_codon:yes stop_codon:yes gene_type:complete
MNGDFRNIRTNQIYIDDIPLINKYTMKINPRWLSNPSISKQFPYGKYSRKDISVGHIHLEVSENGSLIQLIKDHKVYAERSDAPVDIGVKNSLCKGMSYILTYSENAILEINTEINKDWEVNSKASPKIRKYILVKR